MITAIIKTMLEDAKIIRVRSIYWSAGSANKNCALETRDFLRIFRN